MARLIEPDGTASYVVSVACAVEWCRTHKNWSWEMCDSDEFAGRCRALGGVYGAD
jgi:hypothetical protein